MAEAGRKLLVIDDDPALRNTAKMVLATFGYEVDTAENGESALSLLREDVNRFDLILTDLTMPDLNGREVARQAKELGVAAPFVMVSGYVLDEDEFGDEFVGYLLKPFRMQQLKEQLEEIFAKVQS